MPIHYGKMGYLDEDLLAVLIYRDWVIDHDIPIHVGDDIVTSHRERWMDAIVAMYMDTIIKTRFAY